jgi:cytochrome c oxidase cbb3-type subunit 2
MKTKDTASWLSIGISVALIAATYVYFLIFAQFAYLHLVESHVPAANLVRPIMAAMAIAGLAGSLAAGRLLRPAIVRLVLCVCLAECGASALLATHTRHANWFYFNSAAIGFYLSVLTVSLCVHLNHTLPRARRGLCIGLGTGLAYAICNIPAVFAAAPLHQGRLAAVFCFGALILALVQPASSAVETPVSISSQGQPAISFPSLTVILGALVWLDSAAFVIIQTTPVLNAFGWSTASLQWSNAALHLMAAVLAGLWLDRRGMPPVLLTAFAALAVASVLLRFDGPAAHFTNGFYTAGVSLYSTALVLLPLAGFALDSGAVARRAGLLFGFAGWCGSVLGIGMAQDLHTIPIWFVCLSGIVIFARLRLFSASPALPILAPATAGALLILILAASALRPKDGYLDPPPAPRMADVVLGREVYIGEGCIHCHSQYVRKGTPDEEWWGPAADPARIVEERPPLIGNRRQGPDLLNLSNRRSAEWNRIHLMHPRALSPGSCMPSYSYLFRDGDSRGEALVAYLTSLGSATLERRIAVRQSWAPRRPATPVSEPAARALFQQNCVACHGPGGAGDGRFASEVGPRAPRDLTKAEWSFMPRHATDEQRLLELARVIKFGIPTTSMPGHEKMSDPQLLGLAQYVVSLQNIPAPP